MSTTRAPERDGIRDLVFGARVAARSARDHLENAARTLEPWGRESEEIRECERRIRAASSALETLVQWGAERDGAGVAELISGVIRALGVVLRTLQCVENDDLDGPTADVAQATSLLYAFERGLERLLAAEREREPDVESADDDEAAPIVLARRRRVLEIVPDDDSPSSEMPRPPEDRARKSAPRLALDVDIGWHSDTNFYVGFSDDIREGGLFVATHSPLPIGTRIMLSFELPHGPRIVAAGRVAWIRDPVTVDLDTRPGMGVAFEELDPTAEKAIRKYASVRPPIFHD